MPRAVKKNKSARDSEKKSQKKTQDYMIDFTSIEGCEPRPP